MGAIQGSSNGCEILRSLSSPLLPNASAAGVDVEAGVAVAGGSDTPAFVVHLDEPPSARPRSSVTDSCWNLCNIILGAGLYALPRVYAALGLLGGTAAVAGVAWLTYASIDLMLRASEALHRGTYASTLRTLWGRRAAAAVHAAVVAGCAGFIALYLIITCDVVVGNAKYTGILPDLFPALPDPLPWYLSRTALISWITLAAGCLLRADTLHGLAVVSELGVAASLTSTAGVVALCGIAAAQGRLAPLRWLPDPAFFGDRPAVIATHMLATVPTLMTSFLCHMSVHPLMQDLADYTPARMRSVARRSLAACAGVYALMGAAGVALFGAGVQGDVLANLQPEAVAALLGGRRAAALALVATLKLSVVGAMLTSIAIVLWPLRAEVLDLLHQALAGAPSKPAFYAVTYGSLAAIYAAAVGIQNSYSMVGLVGATCGISMAFIFPALIALRLGRVETGSGVAGRRLIWLGWVLLALGVLLTAAGIASTILGIDDLD